MTCGVFNPIKGVDVTNLPAFPRMFFRLRSMVGSVMSSLFTNTAIGYMLMASSRRAEFEADAHAADIYGSDAVISGLRKM